MIVLWQRNATSASALAQYLNGSLRGIAEARSKHTDARCERLIQSLMCQGESKTLLVLCAVRKPVASSTAKRNEEPRTVHCSWRLMQ